MTTKQRSFLNDTFVYGLSSVLSLGVGFLLIPLYTHALSTAEFGLYELLNIVANTLFVFIYAGTINSFARFYFDKDDTAWKKQVTATSIVFNILSFCVIASATLLLQDWLVLDIIQDKRAFLYLDLLLLWMFFEILFRIGTTFLQINLLPGAYLATQTAKAALFVGFCVYFLMYRGQSIEGILTANIISCSIFGSSFLLFVLYWTRLKLSLKLMGELLRYGLPYLPATLFAMIIGISDRFFLNKYFDLSEVGIYVLALKIGVISTLLLSQAFAKVWGPFVFKNYHREDGKKMIGHVYESYAKLLIVTAFCVALAGPILIPFISAPEYHRAGALIPIICLGAIIQGLALSADTGLLVAKKTKYKILVGFYGAIAALCANMLLIPTLGMLGAAMAFITGMGVILIGNIRYANRFYRLPIEWSLLAKGIGLGALIYVGFFVSTQGISTESVLTQALIQSLLALIALVVYVGTSIMSGLVTYKEFASFVGQITQMLGVKNDIRLSGKKVILAKLIHGRYSPFQLLLPRHNFLFPAIVTYHRVFSAPADYPMTTSVINATPEAFEEQLIYLKKRFNVMNFRLLHELMEEDKPIPLNSLIITFDDGYFDNHKYALPLLIKYGLTATVFISTGYIDSGRSFWVDSLAFQISTMRPSRLSVLDGEHHFDVHENNRNDVRVAIGRLCATVSPADHQQILAEIAEQTGISEIAPQYQDLCRPMNWQEVCDLDAAGIEIGAHSVDHGYLDRYNSEDLHRELVDSKNRIEEVLNKPVISMAYPSGKYDARVIDATKAAGYKYCCAFDSSFNNDRATAHLHRLSRIVVGINMPISLYKAQLTLPRLFL